MLYKDIKNNVFSLESISIKFNVKKEEILRVNKINYIYPTQEIVID